MFITWVQNQSSDKKLNRFKSFLSFFPQNFIFVGSFQNFIGQKINSVGRNLKTIGHFQMKKREE